MEKQKMETADMVKENIDRIGKLFPHCVTETTDKNGNPVHAIDFDKLRQELGEAIVEGKKERYQFTWPMKSQASALANTPTTMTLRPDKESSKNFDTTENLYIEGDNLEVLKVLRETYLGKVKMIYIDPPYNTGKDFVYKDNRFLTQKEMDTLEGKYDEYGNIYKTNTESNGRFHTDWLNMMYPRLKVARDLLSDDGFLFISIDDKELSNVFKICNEIFGETNYVTNFLWRKKSTTSNVKGAEVSSLCDNTLCYRKSEKAKISPRIKNKETRNYPLKDKEGSYRTAIIEKKDSGDYKRDSMKFPILGHTPREGKRWQIGIDSARKLEEANRFIFDGEKILLKIYDFEDKDTTSAQPNLLLEHGTSDSAAKMVNLDLFNISELFTNPKPIELLSHLILIAGKEDSIILDFFSGSGTTAHAVMKLNAEDGGNRKFIMVQLAEETEEGSEARKAGYKNICEIGKERIRRAGEKVKEEAGLQGQDLDIGFRVLKLDSSNMKDVSMAPSQIGTFNFDDVLDNVKEGRTDLDLLFQIMLNNSIPLSANIKEQSINGHKIYNVDGSDLIAVFDRSVDDKTITEIAKMQPLKFVMREPENSPENKYNPDNIIDNFEQIFDLYSPNTIRRVL